MKILLTIENGMASEIFADDPERLEIEIIDLDALDGSRDKKRFLVNYIVATQHLKQV